MKNKIYILIILLILSFVSTAKDEKVIESKTVEVRIEKDGDKETKKVTINGKELSPEEIKEFEASGQMKILHLDSSEKHTSPHKVIMIDKEAEGNLDEDIEISVESDGDKLTKKVKINGKNLSPKEIKEFEASGKMKIIHLDKDIHGIHGNKMVFIDAGDDEGSNVDVEVIMDQLNNFGNGHQVWNSDDGKKIKIFTKSLTYPGDNTAISLGFMTMQQADGLHIGYLLEGSDAKKSGLKEDDLIIKINGVDFTVDKDSNYAKLAQLKTYKEGDLVKVEIEREGQSLTFNVKAQIQDFSFMNNPPEDFIKWLEISKDNESHLNKELKVMVFASDDKDFKLHTDDINIVFPEELGDMNVFFSDGKSTSKLLGKNHEMSSLSNDLGKYFNTKGGVLVLHVDDSNAFALKDGDVIKSIDGETVNSPKDVIKQLLKADKQEDIKLKIVRHKRNKTLKYNK